MKLPSWRPSLPEKVAKAGIHPFDATSPPFFSAAIQVNEGRRGRVPRRVWGLLVVVGVWGLALWLVFSGLLVFAAWQGGDSLARAGAAAATLLVSLVLCFAAPWLVVLAGMVYLTHQTRRRLPQWVAPWRRRALRARMATQSLAHHVARPVLVGYGVAATVRALLRVPQRVWKSLKG